MPSDNGNTHLGLASEAKWGNGILDSLLHAHQQSSHVQSDVPTVSALPRTAVARACAIGFFEQNKYGAVVAVTKSRGFVVANLGWENGRPRWSAPCFFEISTGGIGLSFGHETVYTAILINTAEALDEFVQSKTVVEMDMNFQMQTQPVVKEDDDLGWDDLTENEVKVYSVAQGKMLDVSVQGGKMSPSLDNLSYYGPTTAVEDILHGDVTAPKEFTSFYDKLSKLAQEGAMVIQKLKDEGVKVYPIYHSEAGWRCTHEA